MNTFFLITLRTLCCFVFAASVSAQTVNPQPNAPATKEQSKSSTNAEAAKVAEAIDKRVKELEEKANANANAVNAIALEGQRKNADWLFSALGIVLTIFGLLVAFLGIFIPLVWQRNERQRLNEAKDNIDKTQAIADKTLKTAEAALDKIREIEKSATDSNDRYEKVKVILGNATYNNKDDKQADNKQSRIKDADLVLAASEIDDNSKLRALAIKAAEKNEIVEASLLWQTLANYEPENVNVLANAGIWLDRELDADHLKDNINARKRVCLYLEKSHSYDRADINLVDALCYAMLKLARTQNICGETDEENQTLNKAVEILEKQAQINNHSKITIAYNLASVYARLNRVDDYIVQLKIAAAGKKLPDKSHIQSDPDFDNVRNTPVFQAWWKEQFGE